MTSCAPFLLAAESPHVPTYEGWLLFAFRPVRFGCIFIPIHLWCIYHIGLRLICFHKFQYCRSYVLVMESSANWCIKQFLRTPLVALVVKNLPANTGDARDVSSVPGLGRSPGGGHGTSVGMVSVLMAPVLYPGKPHGQKSLEGYSHGVAESWTWLKQLAQHSSRFFSVLSF